MGVLGRGQRRKRAVPEWPPQNFCAPESESEAKVLTGVPGLGTLPQGAPAVHWGGSPTTLLTGCGLPKLPEGSDLLESQNPLSAELRFEPGSVCLQGSQGCRRRGHGAGTLRSLRAWPSLQSVLSVRWGDAALLGPREAQPGCQLGPGPGPSDAGRPFRPHLSCLGGRRKMRPGSSEALLVCVLTPPASPTPA